jgi:hypothetical protein
MIFFRSDPRPVVITWITVCIRSVGSAGNRLFCNIRLEELRQRDLRMRSRKAHGHRVSYSETATVDTDRHVSAASGAGAVSGAAAASVYISSYMASESVLHLESALALDRRHSMEPLRPDAG